MWVIEEGVCIPILCGLRDVKDLASERSKGSRTHISVFLTAAITLSHDILAVVVHSHFQYHFNTIIIEKGCSFSPETRYDLANCPAAPPRILVKALHGIGSPILRFAEGFIINHTDLASCLS